MSRESLSPKAHRLLSAYLDGELSARQRARVEQRLATDAAWRQAYAELRAVKQGLALLRAEGAPRRFTLTRAEAAARRPQRGLRMRRVYRWASVLTALLLFAAVAGTQWGRGNLSSAPAQEAPRALAPAAAPLEDALPATAAPKAVAPMAAAAPQAESAEGAGRAATPPTATASPAPTPALSPATEARSSFPVGQWLGVVVLAGAALGFAWLGWRRP